VADRDQGRGAIGGGVREAGEEDLEGILAIYNDVIRTSTAVFSDEQVTLEERARWLEGRRGQGYPVLVVGDRGSGIVGFGSFGDFRAGPGYRTTVEHSVHVRADRRGQGIGTTLVSALIERAGTLGKHAIIAGVDAGNVASLRLHERLGFAQVARLPEVARKFDRWLDLVLLELLLS
jgi:L-amino acid N-acyltransferase YncA